ncbi:MAG: hypothetical protein ACW99A_23615, partial [Candidatus Kariarchaeaceae archaeon]
LKVRYQHSASLWSFRCSSSPELLFALSGIGNGMQNMTITGCKSEFGAAIPPFVYNVYIASVFR